MKQIVYYFSVRQSQYGHTKSLDDHLFDGGYIWMRWGWTGSDKTQPGGIMSKSEVKELIGDDNWALFEDGKREFTQNWSLKR